MWKYTDWQVNCGQMASVVVESEVNFCTLIILMCVSTLLRCQNS